MSQIAMRRSPGLHIIALLAALAAALPGLLSAQEKGTPATCVAAPGALMLQGKAGWKAIKPGEAITADATLVSLFAATLRSANGGVTVRMVADLGQRGPLPILESAIALHDDAKHDLALTPLRGLMVLTNSKEKGPA